MLHGLKMYINVFIYKGFDIDDLFSVSFRVDAQTLWMLLWVAYVSLVNGGAKYITYYMSVARRSFGAFVDDVFIGRIF